jgi:transcriptional regulator of acetoin/glycerol metabolism
MQKEPPVTKDRLLAVLAHAGTPEKAAPLLGKSRRTVYRYMQHYGIRRQPAFEEAA